MRVIPYIICSLCMVGVCVGGLILWGRGESPTPSYVMLEWNHGGQVLQATDVQALYARFLEVDKQRELRNEAYRDEFVSICWPWLQEPGDLVLKIYDARHREIGRKTLCKHLPFTIFEPLAPLTGIKDCVGEADRGVFYRHQREWCNEKNLIYEALQEKEVEILKYLIAQRYHRNRNMEKPAPVDFAERIHFDEGARLLRESLAPGK